MEEIFETLKTIQEEFFELLRKKHPQLTKIYEMRYEYALGQYPMVMRLHNAHEILKTYISLKQEKMGGEKWKD